MISAILSDVHSNLEALERVCAHAEAAGAQRFVCLGDCVGYGADPVPTLTRLMALPGLVAVRGNHDEALFQKLGSEVNADIRASLDWTRARLTPAQHAFLAGLPLLHRELPPDGDAHDSRDGGGRAASGIPAEGGASPAPRGSASGARGNATPGRRFSLTFVHASAHRPTAWDYLYAPEQIRACLEDAGTQLTFIGHVHVPRVFYEMPGTDVREFDPPDGVPIPLSPYRRYVINVGSVGQPRDGNNAACYVLYDDALAEITFHRLVYDYAATAAKIRAAGLSPFFADRLAAGR